MSLSNYIFNIIKYLTFLVTCFILQPTLVCNRFKTITSQYKKIETISDKGDSIPFEDKYLK